MKTYSLYIALFALLIITSACSTADLQMRKEIAQRIAAPSWMVKRYISTGSFDLMAYERMHKRYEPANVYIEGEGDAADFSRTPENPVALRLASRDKTENLVYLARPCQYQKAEDTCADTYWQGSDFSENVIAGYSGALDEIKARYNITGFNLIGHAGGGAIAALLAAERDDVLSLRTVSGILDHTVFTDLHGQAFSNSLNPASYGAQLSSIPQYHFTGETDDRVPESVYHSYAASLSDDHCLMHDVVAKTNHHEGWTDVWPELLKKKPACAFQHREIIMPEPYIELPPEPIKTQRIKPSKP